MWDETLFSYFGRQRGKPLSKLKTRAECLNILSNPGEKSSIEFGYAIPFSSPNTLLLVCPEFLVSPASRFSYLHMCSPTVEEIRESLHRLG